MITSDALLEAARYSDARTEEHGLEQVIEQAGIDSEALAYVANQRALRAAMILDGQDPRKLSQTEDSSVTLGPEAAKMMSYLGAMFMDGVVVGITVKEIDNG